MRDAVIKEAAVYDDVSFTGRTTLDLDRDHTQPLEFHGCTFDGENPYVNGAYALYVPPTRRPFARFTNCTFQAADKAAVAQWCWFENSLFQGCEDGIMAQKEMRLHVEGNTFTDLGGFPGAHADGVQCQSGSYMLVKHNTFDLAGSNSWCFIESAAGPVSDVRIIGNKGTGGMYHVYLWDDKFGPPKRCMVDHNRWNNHGARLPVAYNFAGGEEMIGEKNKYGAWEG